MRHKSEEIINKIRDQVLAAVRRIVQLRKLEGFYKDDQESSAKHYFTTLEGLESILIPSLALGYSDIASEITDIIFVLEEDLEYILRFNAKRSRRKNQGTPYFVTGRGAGKEYYWLSECAAFTLSTLINILQVAQLCPTKAPNFSEHTLNHAIRRNLKDILECQTENGGWSWSKGGKSADAWATWSIVETLSDYLSYSNKPKLRLPGIKKVKASLDRARSYLSDQLTLADPKALSSRWHREVFEGGSMRTDAQVKLGYAFVQTMISASLLGLRKHKDFLCLASALFQSVDKVMVRRVENSARVASKNTNIQDYSFHSTLLRALTSLYVQMTPRDRKLLAQKLPRSIEFYVCQQYNRLSANYIIDGSWHGLWGHHKTYEIYYTERALEALVSLLEFMQTLRQHKENWSVDQPKKLTRTNLKDEIRKVKELSSKQLVSLGSEMR